MTRSLLLALIMLVPHVPARRLVLADVHLGVLRVARRLVLAVSAARVALLLGLRVLRVVEALGRVLRAEGVRAVREESAVEPVERVEYGRARK